MSEEAFDDVTSLQTRLAELRAEHRDLDDAIARLGGAPQDDELLLRRLKKRKLALKDRISVIERMLEPDEPA
ncbi:YdcH family protein [Aromatoleum sp.]|uniref:YdcH family protein n=1 Tax=Aromatoleum sp. TaxID=2307007 RepID=UPI002FCA4E05